MMRLALLLAALALANAQGGGINDEFLADGVIHDLSDPSMDDDADMAAENDRRRLAFGDILRLYGALDGRTAGRKFCGDVPNYLAMDKRSCQDAADDLSKSIYRTRCAWKFRDMDDTTSYVIGGSGDYLANQGEMFYPQLETAGSPPTYSDLRKDQMPAGCVFQLSRQLYATVNVYWNSRVDVVPSTFDFADDTAIAAWVTAGNTNTLGYSNIQRTCGFQSSMGHYNARCLCLKCDQAYCYNRAYPPQFSNSLTESLSNESGASVTVVGARKYLALDSDDPNTLTGASPFNSGHSHSMILSHHAGTCDCTCWLNGNYFGRRCNEMNSQFSCAVAKHQDVNLGSAWSTTSDPPASADNSWALDQASTNAVNFINESPPQTIKRDNLINSCFDHTCSDLTSGGCTCNLQSYDANTPKGPVTAYNNGAEGVRLWYQWYDKDNGDSARYMDPQLKGYYHEVSQCDDYETFDYNKKCWVHGPNKCSKDNCCKALPIDTCRNFMDGKILLQGANKVPKRMTKVTGKTSDGVEYYGEWLNGAWTQDFIGDWVDLALTGVYCEDTDFDGACDVERGVPRTCANADNKQLRRDVDQCYDLTFDTYTDGTGNHKATLDGGARKHNVNVPNMCGVDYCCEEIPQVATCADILACSDTGCAFNTGEDWVLDTVTRFWDSSRVCVGKVMGDDGGLVKDTCTAAECCVDPLTLPSCQILAGYAFVASTVSQRQVYDANFPDQPIITGTITFNGDTSAGLDVADCSLKCTANPLCQAWEFREEIAQVAEDVPAAGNNYVGTPAVARSPTTCNLFTEAKEGHTKLFQIKTNPGTYTSGLRCDTGSKPAYVNSVGEEWINGVGVEKGPLSRWDCERACDIDTTCIAYIVCKDTNQCTAGMCRHMTQLINLACASGPCTQMDTYKKQGGYSVDGSTAFASYRSAVAYSSNTLRAAIEVYPNYYGNTAVTGEVRLAEATTYDASNDQTGTIMLSWDLKKLDIDTGGLNPQGLIKIHEGTSCAGHTQHDDEVGLAYFNGTPSSSMNATPLTAAVWDNIKYTSDSAGSTGVQSAAVNNGYNLNQNNGHVVIIYGTSVSSEAATKIGCGVLRPQTRCLTENLLTGRAESYWTCPPGRELKRKGSETVNPTWNDVTREDVLVGGEATWQTLPEPITCNGTQQDCDEKCCTRENFCELADLITVAGVDNTEEDKLHRLQRNFETISSRLESCNMNLDDTRAKAANISEPPAIGAPSATGNMTYVVYFISCALAFVLAYAML